MPGGARGPGVFFLIPCVDIYEKIDMRTQTFEVPPQEVRLKNNMQDISQWRVAMMDETRKTLFSRMGDV